MQDGDCAVIPPHLQVAHKGIEIANQTCSDVVFYEGMCGNSTTAPCDDVDSLTLKWNEHLVAAMGAANFSVEGSPETPTCATCDTDDCNTVPTDGGDGWNPTVTPPQTHTP